MTDISKQEFETISNEQSGTCPLCGFERDGKAHGMWHEHVLRETTKTGMIWEEKVESLVKLAQATGRYLNAEKDTDYSCDARRKLLDAYAEFCEWRHDEPYVVDEVKAVIEKAGR